MGRTPAAPVGEPDICIASTDELAEQVRQLVGVQRNREIEGDAGLPGGTHVMVIPELTEQVLDADVSECFPDGSIPAGVSVWKDDVEIVVALASLDTVRQRAVYDAQIGETM